MDIGVYGIRGIPSTYSGYETFLTALLPALAERGHSVTVYCRKDEHSPFDLGDYAGVKRRVLPSLRTKQLDTLTHGVLAAIVARVRGHDAVLVCNVANVPFCTVARATGQRVVLNTDGQEWIRGKWGNIARKYFYYCAKTAKYSATALISDCNAMAEIYRTEFGALSTVVPYCWPNISIGGTSSLAHQLAMPYFITGGRLIPENNIDSIAEAYSRTTLPHPLYVLGAANYRSPVENRLRSLARDDARISLVGHVNDRETYLAMLGNALAYVHGHSVGGMNPSLVEAMGSGAVIAALDTPFNREVAGDDAYFFSSCDHELVELFEKLAKIKESEISAVRGRNRQRVQQLYSLESVADYYEAVLHRATTTSFLGSVVIKTPWTAESQFTSRPCGLPTVSAP